MKRLCVVLFVWPVAFNLAAGLVYLALALVVGCLMLGLVLAGWLWQGFLGPVGAMGRAKGQLWP